MSYQYDVIIIGAGVSGTALQYTLSRYTDIKRIALFEKHDDVAQVASHHTQNSQTLHYGDIETNYSFEKAKSVSQGARYVEHYLEAHASEAFEKSHKMVLAVGADECKELRARYKQFKKLFPEAKLLTRKQIAKYEPKVVEGRDEDEEIVALWSPNGYIVDYHALATNFHKRSVVKSKRVLDSFFETEIINITRYEDGYAIHTKKKTYTTRQLVVDAGAMSIKLAKQLGYGDHLSVFSVAGNFYRANTKLLNGKVYRMQLAKLPFAAAHGDPDVQHPEVTRFGPSAKPLLMLERWNYNTVWDYLKSFKWTWDGLATVFKIGTDPVYFSYMAKNILYDIPYFGSRMFAKNAISIIPTLKKSDLKKDKGYGGARPQIINTKTRSIDVGEARIEGKNAVFNITPSPGASTCLANAKRDAEILIENFGGEFRFDVKKFEKDLT